MSKDNTEPFPRTPLGQTDALNGGRDLRETMRANAIQERASESGVAPPNSQTCSLCGALHGRWVKTHTALGETKPCAGSW